MTNAHGGNIAHLARLAGRPAGELLDFSANINPLGPPACVAAALREAAHRLGHYPDPDSADLTDAIAGHLDVAAARVVPGNGSEQLIWWLPRLLGARRIVLPSPGYLDYRRSAEVWGLPVETILLDREQGFAVDVPALAARLRPGDLVWIGQPANPSGRMTDPDRLHAAVASAADVQWAIDEAFIDFVDNGPSAVRWDLPNLSVLRSMTKFYALPGLRLGYAVLPAARAAALRRLLPEWSVSTFAQYAGAAVLRDPGRGDYARRSRRLVSDERRWLAERLHGLGAAVYDGAANYLLLRLPPAAPPAPALASRLLEAAGIAVRVCTNYAGLDDRDVRVAVRGRGDNERLVAALAAALDG
jgi:L-threonine-O-3-phosphate decarboxylase